MNDNNLALRFRETLTAQATWSEKTFGPGDRTLAVIKHIMKELEEIHKDPEDIIEWVDVLQLAFDGARRAGHEIDDILKAYIEKQQVNEKRNWPNWKTHPTDEPMEHIR